MNVKTMLACGLSAALLVCTAGAAAEQTPDRIGPSVDRWVQLQASGSEGASGFWGLDGPAALRAYQQYLKTFELSSSIVRQLKEPRTLSSNVSQ